MIKILDIQDKGFLKDMINIALETKDKKWFNQLTEELNKLEKEDNIELDLFNPKNNQEGHCDLLRYEYYIFQNDCDLVEGYPLAITGNKIHGSINDVEILNKIELIVRAKDNREYKNGDKISRLELEICDDNDLIFTAFWLLGYLGGRVNMNNYCNIIKQENEMLEKQVENLKKYNDLLKSGLKTLQDNHLNNKKKKRFKLIDLNFWKR
ncbi:IDEAL domain-containing protein [Clostridium rectalis]|uniref:IDEAL domain-containing protein n=1 Tax=Clostridium rectalis TaxID=2040295 RepID=UPI000F6420DC|nr:IDEAL domain-containing protein [Clostridium rectalis]